MCERAVSLPPRERELKRVVEGALAWVMVSLPPRERELKLQPLGVLLAQQSRSPRGSVN